MLSYLESRAVKSFQTPKLDVNWIDLQNVQVEKSYVGQMKEIKKYYLTIGS